MKFKQYIAKRQARQNPQGDFVRDARMDKTLPDAKTWDELHNYLRRNNASHAAIESGGLVWATFQKRRKG